MTEQIEITNEAIPVIVVYPPKPPTFLEYYLIEPIEFLVEKFALISFILMCLGGIYDGLL